MYIYIYTGHSGEKNQSSGDSIPTFWCLLASGNDCYSLRTGKWPSKRRDLSHESKGDFPVRYVKLPEGTIFTAVKPQEPHPQDPHLNKKHSSCPRTVPGRFQVMREADGFFVLFEASNRSSRRKFGHLEVIIVSGLGDLPGNHPQYIQVMDDNSAFLGLSQILESQALTVPS